VNGLLLGQKTFTSFLEQFLDFQTKNGQNDQILEKNHENSWKLAENLLDPKTIHELFGVKLLQKAREYTQH